MLKGAITSDIDTLRSIYKGLGCRRKGGYTGVEFRMGLQNFVTFLEEYGVKATFFMVGNDFLNDDNHPVIREVHSRGHEIANHTMTHAQGFRLMSVEQKEQEISGMEDVCEGVIGVKPKGFRSPGWNIGDGAISLLSERGYLYDSSVFPTSVMPLLKLVHWKKSFRRNRYERSTMGHLRYIMAPRTPYRISASSFGKRGEGELIEFPISVSPILRLPLTATFTMAAGIDYFNKVLRRIRDRALPINYQFHLSDFADYSIEELSDQLPASQKGVYVPQALRTPLKKKMDLHRRAMDELLKSYSFTTLAHQATDHNL